MDFASDPNTWDAMTWDAAAKDISANGPTGQAFEPVLKFAESMNMQGEPLDKLSTTMAGRAPPRQPKPIENLKSLFQGDMFKNPNKNPYPGRTALGGNAGEIFGNAMEQR